MTAAPRVSLLVPTRNRRTFLPRLLRYVQRQTWPADRLELVVVDDGTDRIDDLLVDPPVSLVYEHVGDRVPLGSKRNRLVELASGDVLVHFDDDDHHPADRVARSVACLEETGADVVGTSRLAFWDVGTRAVHVYPPIGPRHAHAGTMAFRRSYWEANRFAPDATAEERQFLRCFVANLAQLPGEPWETVLCISHGDNALPKNTALPRASVGLADIVPDPDDRAFYESLPDEDW
ncbi:MAG: glycosyltransferase [Alphaproteobacteria bacterium]|nr:glycosyltransferase [Alphaproteobacteria bacterium]